MLNTLHKTISASLGVTALNFAAPYAVDLVKPLLSSTASIGKSILITTGELVIPVVSIVAGRYVAKWINEADTEDLSYELAYTHGFEKAYDVVDIAKTVLSVVSFASSFIPLGMWIYSKTSSE